MENFHNTANYQQILNFAIEPKIYGRWNKYEPKNGIENF